MVAGWQGTMSFSYQGSGATTGTNVSVQRSFSGPVVLDAPGPGFLQPLAWDGNLVAAQARFSYKDVLRIQDRTNGTWTTTTINGIVLGEALSGISVTFSDAAGGCQVVLDIGPFVVTDDASVSTPIAPGP
jgi:hypothetical protein